MSALHNIHTHIRTQKSILIALMGLFLLCGTGTLKAATVDEATAHTVAANVLGTSNLVNRTSELYSSWQTNMFLFVPESGVGFALISATDYALPVLGYSTTAVFDPVSTTNSYFEMYQWLNYCNTQLNDLKGGSYPASAMVSAQWAQLRSGAAVGTIDAIAPMLATKWDQTGDYMLRTPMSGSSTSAVHCPVGGAAVAMAQVMRYYGHPESGTGSFSYTNSGSWSTTVSANFNTIYDYANMPDQLTDGSTDIQKGAVSHLLFHTGVSVQMRYYSNRTYPYSSGGSPIANALKNYFRFRTTTTYRQMNSSNYSTWNTLIMDEIAAGRPVIYTCQNFCTFVIDGCDNRGNFHINWGRGGVNDGYYAVGSLNPGSSYLKTYQSHQVVIGIEPNPTYTISVEANDISLGSVSGGGTYWEGESVTLQATPNFGSRFRRWSNGTTNNPLTFTVGDNRNDTAIFEYIGTADIQVTSNNESWGSVSGGGLFERGDMVVLRTRPNPGYKFEHWSSGSTDNPRIFRADVDINDTAVFVWKGIANISTASSNPERGSVSGGGTYTIGTPVVLTANPVSGWIFDHWDDGENDNPRHFIANGDRTCVAYFVRPDASDPQFHLVQLDDRESHSWSYYSDSTCLVRSLNPADIKIKYFGYGENTMYSSDALNPEGDPDTEVSPYMVGIGIDAPWKNTYVYHKTLERVNGEQAESMAAADGPCFYRLIPNPYSRRPTHGTGTTRWRGFYKWRLKALSGGTVFRDTAMNTPVPVGTMLDAEDTVYFMPAAEYGMEVEWEAIWARAVVYSTTTEFDISESGSYVSGRNAYERNFVVYNCEDCLWRRDSRGAEKDFTMTSVYPDGTDGISPSLLTKVPSYRNLNKIAITHRLIQLNTATILGTSAGRSLVPLPSSVNPVVLDSLTFTSNSMRTGSSVSFISSMPIFYPWETLKFEYIKLSVNRDMNLYHGFCPRNLATQSDDSTWYVIANPSRPGTSSSYYLNRGDTIWLKQYNGDTLVTRTGIKYGTSSYWPNGKNIKGGQFICGRMCLPEDGCGFFLLGYEEFWGTTEAELRDPKDKNVRYRLESGTFEKMFWFLSPNINSDKTCNGKITLDVVLGSDYDRSRGDNSKLSIPRCHGANQLDIVDSINKGTRMFNYVIKSGRFTERYDGNVANEFNPLAYLGDRGAKGYCGGRNIIVEGGDISCIGGGKDSYDDTIEYVDRNHTQVRVYMKGGRVEDAVYGAATRAFAKGARRMVFTGGEINGWIAGGCNGTDISNGILRGNSYIYFGGQAKLQHSARDIQFFYSKGGNLFGAGSGHHTATGPEAYVGKVDNSYIVVADSSYISRNVYGGGNYGHVGGDSSNIQILGGTVAGKVFGGSNRQRAPKINIEMRAGTVIGGVYGGSNTIGEVKGPIMVHIKGGTVGATGCADTLGNVFGCGYGSNTSVTGTVHVIIGSKDAKQPHQDNPVIHGHVYGGGDKGSFDAAEDTIRVTTWNGRIKKSVFGGGYGPTAVTTGNTNVNILGTTYVGGNVYGGGNKGKVTGNTKVIIGD